MCGGKGLGRNWNIYVTSRSYQLGRRWISFALLIKNDLIGYCPAIAFRGSPVMDLFCLITTEKRQTGVGPVPEPAESGSGLVGV